MFTVFNDNEVLSEALKDYIEKKLHPFTLPEYAYLVVSKRNPLKTLAITNYPTEWVEQYKKNNYHNIDPVILTAFKRISPFFWDENITLITDLKVNKIFELSKNYNIVNGVTFVVHDHLNNIATLSFIINKKIQINLEDIINENKFTIQFKLIEIHEHMLKLVESQKSKVSKYVYEEGKTIFTERENAVLYWASMGKTYAEIAVILGISQRTVKMHMGNLVQKLGVNNARQAIRLGVELRLINPL